MNLFNQIEGLQYELTDISRNQLRQNLFKKFNDPDLLDLSQPPQTTSPYISISHTDGLSGWVSYSKPVGFDVEKSDRKVDKALLLRVSKESEVINCPNPLALWVAKEAAFKSLWRSEKPTLLSHIQVLDWQCLNANLFEYKFSNINNLAVCRRGWVEVGPRFTLGIALGEA